MLKSTARLAFVSILWAATADAQSVGPSFDCSTKPVGTQPLAQMICRSRTLAHVELSYVIAYQALRESSAPAVRKAMVDDANALVVAINDECNIPKTGVLLAPPTETNVHCIKTRFDRQRFELISRLSGAARDEGILEPAETIAIQRGLQSKSYLPATADIDGVFGPVSRQAILAWQKDNSLPETGFGSKAMLAALTGRPQANTAPSTTYPYPPPAAPSPRAPTPVPEVRIGSDVVRECIVGQIAKLSITGESANAVASAAISLCNETIRRDLANYCAVKERACNPTTMENQFIEIIQPRVAALVMQFRAEAAQQQVKEKGPSPGSPPQEIARLLEDGIAARDKGDYATALRLWRPLAEQGNAVAQFNLGLMYANGQGVTQDYAAAVSWYRKSADQGNADAQHGLGFMYSVGYGVPQDSTTALSWYRKAAEQGDARMQGRVAFNLSIGLGIPAGSAESAKWNAESAKWYRKAAEQGDVQSQASLGEAYRTGKGALIPLVPQDYTAAAYWLHKAAEQGDDGAQHHLGHLYREGQGVPQDYAAAVSWYRKAADQGNPYAQNVLGEMYEKGEGVMHDYVRAYQWYDLAVLRLTATWEELRLPIGDRDEVFIGDRDRISARMTPAQVEAAQKLAREWKPTQPIVSPTAPTVSAPSPHSSAFRSSIQMKKEGGTYVVPVLVNNAITLDFMVDSGASDVSIPEDVVSTLIRAGTIRDTDFIGEQTYVLADGSRVKSKTFRIRSLKVGDRVLENVTGSVADKKGTLLLGQSFLGRFKSWSIDNTKHALVLE